MDGKKTVSVFMRNPCFVVIEEFPKPLHTGTVQRTTEAANTTNNIEFNPRINGFIFQYTNPLIFTVYSRLARHLVQSWERIKKYS
jgi:hypothetical protein